MYILNIHVKHSPKFQTSWTKAVRGVDYIGLARLTADGRTDRQTD